MEEETLENHYVVAYQRNLGLEYQQQTEELKGTVDEDYGFAETGESFTFDWLGKGKKLRRIEDRHGDTPATSGPQRKRRVGFFDAYEIEDPLGTALDAARSVADPSAKIVMQQKMDIARHHDARKREAILGVAREGRHGATTVAFPAGNVIAVNSNKYDALGAANSKLTVSKVQEAKVFFDERKVPKSERFISVSSHLIAGLLRDPFLASADYNTVQAMVSGEIRNWHGFTWVPHEEWSDTAPQAAGQDLAVCWHKMSVQYKSRILKPVEVFRRKEKRNNWWTYGELESGGIRGYDEGVLKIICLT